MRCGIPGMENGYLSLCVATSFRHLFCSLHHINTDASDSSRVSERLEPSHGDFPPRCLVSRDRFICPSSELSRRREGGPSGPILFSFLRDVAAVFLRLLTHPLALPLFLSTSSSLLRTQARYPPCLHADAARLQTIIAAITGLLTVCSTTWWGALHPKFPSTPQ